MFLLDTEMITGEEAYMKGMQSLMLTEEQGRALMNVVMVLAALVVIYMIYRFIEKIVSKFLPEKKETVIVERTHFNQTGKRMKVRNVATGKKKVVLMPEAQYAAGAKGELVRKGRYGISFVPEMEEEKKDAKKHYQKSRFKE